MAKQASKQKIKEECKKAKEQIQEKFWKQVDEMLMAHGYGTEIAAFFGISADCLYERCRLQKNMAWSVYAQSKTEKGKVLLRTSQFRKAVTEKNCQMQIHLGKHWLNQTERQVITTQEIKPAQRAVLKCPANGRRTIPKSENETE